MKSTKFIRALREGWLSFYRDKWLTLATLTIMTLTLFLIGTTLFLWVGVTQTIRTIEQRINVSVYFDLDITEDEIIGIKESIEEISPEEIKSMAFVSREDAYKDFQESEKDNPEMVKAFELIEGNPLSHALVVTASDAGNYEKINSWFEDNYGDKILSTNFQRNENTIRGVRDQVVFVRNVTLFLSALFIIIAVLVTFNTVRMSIYANRKEFEIMRLVGASNLYIKLPVIFEGVLYGVTSAILASLLLIFSMYLLNPFAEKLLADANIVEFYGSQIVVVICLTILTSILLGMASSYVAIRRYLEK